MCARPRPTTFGALCLSGLLIVCAPAAGAHEIQSGHLAIIHPHVDETPAHATSSRGRMSIRNHGDMADRLLGIESPGTAATVTLCRDELAGSDPCSKPLDEGIPVPATSEVDLGGAGIAVVFTGLVQPFAPGELIDATLLFEHAGKVQITFEVQ